MEKKPIDALLADLRALYSSLSATALGANDRVLRRVAELYAQITALEELRANAQRYRGIRLVLTEPDKAKQTRIIAALEAFIDQQEIRNNVAADCGMADPINAARVDELFDRAILCAAETARGGA